MTGWQTPPVHAPPSQECPQRPQLPASFAVSTHAPPQLANEAVQPQTPAPLQAPFVPQLAHAAPLAPQLAEVSLAYGSHVVALLQQPAQPLEPLQTHVVPEHVVPAPHALPHEPQLLLSFSNVRQAFPHLVVPAAVHVNVQVVAEHVDVPPAGGVAQEAHTPPQSSVPGGHWQEPSMQLPNGQAPHAAPAVPFPQRSVVSFAGDTHVLPLQHPAHDAASHATAQAPLKQTWFAPHAGSGVRSCTLLTNRHAGPEEQVISPFWHGLSPGLHGAFAVHAAHEPALQTPVVAPLVHDVPSVAATSVSVQVATPFVQAETLPT